MRALIWITEETWRECVDEARVLIADGAEILLLHVSPSDVEEVAAGGVAGLLGRRHPTPPGPPLRALADEEAQALLAHAHTRLQRPAQRLARRGRIEREVLAACADADLLVLARDDATRAGPASIGPHTRFVLDHAMCQVLLVRGAAAPDA